MLLNLGRDNRRNNSGGSRASSAGKAAGLVLGGSSSAHGNHASELSKLRALLDSGHDVLAVLGVPGDDVGGVGRVLGGQRSGSAEVAGVGLGVLEEIGDDLGGGSGDALGEVKNGGLTLGGDVAERGEAGLARLNGGALHDGVGHEVDVGRDGGGQEGGDNDGLHFDGFLCLTSEDLIIV